MSSFPVYAMAHRLYDVSGPAWRVMVHVRGVLCSYTEIEMTVLPMASAVVDDFGQLVLVTPWR